MRGAHRIFDDFLPFAGEFREEALIWPFSNVTGPDGEVYKRVQVRENNEFGPRISAALGHKVAQSYSLLRLNYAGELPNNAIHADSGYDSFAGVLYLNPTEQCQGGTAFWRHKATGFEKLPTAEEVRRLGKSPKRVLETLQADWNRPEAWELVEVVDMKWNRLVIYPSKRFHSRYPFEAFGNCPDNGRLIWVTFFSVE